MGLRMGRVVGRRWCVEERRRARASRTARYSASDESPGKETDGRTLDGSGSDGRNHGQGREDGEGEQSHGSSWWEDTEGGVDSSVVKKEEKGDKS